LQVDYKNKNKNMKNFSEFINEGNIADKDWKRMSDLVLSGKDGASVAKSIKDKNKAIARFVSGLKLENKTPDYNERWKEYRGYFSEFGNKALELGATVEEIQAVFDETEIPSKYAEQLTDLSDKKLDDRFVGTLSKAVLDNGFDINYLHSGNALTIVGKDAMRRSGRKWTIGYKTEITLGDKVVKLSFDAITDEGDGPTSYFIDNSGSDPIFRNPYGHEEVGKIKFVASVIKALNDNK